MASSSRGGGYERLPMYASSESTTRLRSPTSISSHPHPARSPPPPSPIFSPPPLLSSPPPRRRRSWNATPTPKSFLSWRPRSFATLIKILLPSSLLVLLFIWYRYEPHIELAFYNRAWIKSELGPSEHVRPLAGCFNEDRVSRGYNVSERVYGVKKTEVQAGMPMRMGMDCYEFAGTIKAPSHPTTSTTSRPLPVEQRTHFHTYWRTDLAPFGPRQEYMLKSFFATQHLPSTRLILWSNGDLSSNPILQHYLTLYPESFTLRVVDVAELAKGTELQGSNLLSSKDSKAWTDGDLVRLLLLWGYGGVWIDMDSLLTRDLSPLLEHEFVTQWDCYDKIYQPLNGALMHFHQHSPYLCEAFHIMSTSAPPRSGSTDWGSLLYHKLWRRLIAASVPPFKVLPFCFSDARSCRLDNRLPDPFVPDGRGGEWTMGMGREEGGGLDKVLGKVFSVHLHNQWEKEFPSGGWVERLLLRRYEEQLGKTGETGTRREAEL